MKKLFAELLVLSVFNTAALADTNNVVLGSYLGNGTASSSLNEISIGMDLTNYGGVVIHRAPVESGALWFDSVQGEGKYLDSTSYDASNATITFSGFTEQGFGVQGHSSYMNEQGREYNYLALAEKAGFLDIVIYSGDQSSSRAIPHSLGTNVGMVIIKNITNAQDGIVWHKALSSGSNMENVWLFGNTGSNSATEYAYAFGNRQPDENSFYVGASSSTNGSGKQYIAYVFADNPESGVSVGKYTGNSTDGVLASFPWQPDALIIKPINTSLANNFTMWSPHIGKDRYNILDRVRAGYDTMLGAYMELNRDGELVKTTRVAGHNISYNETGKDYIYIALKNMGPDSNSPIKVKNDVTLLSGNAEHMVDVLANDTIPEGIVTNLIVDSISNPAFAAQVLDGKLSVTTPSSGSTTITYYLEDASGSGISSATATVNIGIDVAVARDDQFEVFGWDEHELNLLENDTLSTSLDDKLVLHNDLNAGAQVSLIDGKLMFSAALSGTYQFSYHLVASDGNVSNTAIVQVTVTSIVDDVVAEYLFEDPSDLGKDTSGNSNHGVVIGSNHTQIERSNITVVCHLAAFARQSLPLNQTAQHTMHRREEPFPGSQALGLQHQCNSSRLSRFLL